MHLNVNLTLTQMEYFLIVTQFLDSVELAEGMIYIC